MNQNAAEIVQCRSCGTKNKIPGGKPVRSARCGRCHTALFSDPEQGKPEGDYTLRCMKCHARNRVPAGRIEAGPKCGKCGQSLPTHELFLPQPVMVTDVNFSQTVLNSPLPVLLFCWAPWCPTCGVVAPIIDEFGRDAKGKVRVGKVNIDNSPQIASRFNILSVPFLMIFDNGKMQESMPGGLQKHELMMKLAHYL